ncbi:MAG: tRNA (adenosine(37)-N6)-dimethylallyltransferase MiaA [Candidatus Eisenbacteria bacterium]|nr:tRNA (adenosine(37)-N6)-dimethylallyltransferase MiaA [Candidatus Eisenbacteria bacterium]
MVRDASQKLLVPGIVGPTAVGKTAVAVRIAESQGWEIVSADSRQIYRELDIGTAKPTPEERSRAPHHLVDVVEPWEAYSCGRYKVDATAAMETVAKEGRVPIVVGGSGLYLRALERGLFEGPERDESLRAELRQFVERQGREALHERLARTDPVSARRIHPRDTERVIRAIEVFELTGESISELQRTSTRPGKFALRLVGLRRRREVLYGLINERVERMLEAGLVEELRRLVQKGFSEAWPSFRTVGYREMVQHLRGEVSYSAATEKVKVQTRRFAKRQMTWLNGASITAWLDVPDEEDADRTAERVLEILKRDDTSNIT